MAGCPVPVATFDGIRVCAAGLTRLVGGARKLAAFTRRLTVTERPQPGRPRHYARQKRKAVRRGRDRKAPHFMFPREASSLLAEIGVPEAELDPSLAAAWAGARRLDAFREAAPLYGYQEAMCRHIDEVCWEGCGRGAAYVEMATGHGKTRVALAAAVRAGAQHGGPVFVVVPTEEIRRQWLEEAAALFPGLRSGAYRNPSKNSRRAALGPDDHDLLVGIVNTVRVKPPDFFAAFGTVVLDEAHEYHSPSNIKVLWLVQGAPRVLGISATPAANPSGLDQVVPLFLGAPVKAEEDVEGYDISGVNFQAQVRKVEYRGHPDHCETVLTEAGTVSAIGTIGAVIADPARLNLVAAEVARLLSLHETSSPEELKHLGLGPRPPEAATRRYPQGEVRSHRVMVFAEHRDYLPALRDVLLRRLGPGLVEAPELEEEDDPDGLTAVLRGGAKETDRKLAKNARVLLITFGYGRRGVSYTGMTALVAATSRRNGWVQILGRVFRRGSDESIRRIIVFITDVRCALKSQWPSQLRTCREKRFPVYRVAADHTTFEDPAAEAVRMCDEELVWAPACEGEEPPDTRWIADALAA